MLYGSPSVFIRHKEPTEGEKERAFVALDFAAVERAILAGAPCIVFDSFTALAEQAKPTKKEKRPSP